MSDPQPGTAETEGRYHRYVSNKIPWYVHMIWICFWILAVSYVVRYLFPEVQKEMRQSRPKAAPQQDVR